MTEREVESRDYMKETKWVIRFTTDERGLSPLDLAMISRAFDNIPDMRFATIATESVGVPDQARAEGRAEALAEVVEVLEARHQELADTNDTVQPGSWERYLEVRDLQRRVQAIAAVRELGKK